MNPFSKSSDNRAADKFVVRFPDSMRDNIALLARQNHRSMNSEIVARLSESIAREQVVQERETCTDASQTEQRLLQRIRTLDNASQQALLVLLDPA